MVSSPPASHSRAGVVVGLPHQVANNCGAGDTPPLARSGRRGSRDAGAGGPPLRREATRGTGADPRVIAEACP